MYSTCSLAELNVLSVGLDPRKVAYDALFRRYGHSNEQDEMLYFLEDRYEAIANGLRIDPENQDAPADMELFFHWTQEVGFQLENRFRRMLREKFKRSSSIQKRDVNKSNNILQQERLHRSSYNFHAILLYSMAVEKFGLDDRSKIPQAIKRIKNCAELQGQTASRKPIQDLLETGCRLCEEISDRSNQTK